MRSSVLAAAWVIGCGGPVHAHEPDPSIEQTGIVVDEAGQPLPGIAVLVCINVDPCQTLADEARLSPLPLEELFRRKTAFPLSDRVALVKTDAHGRWRKTFPRSWTGGMFLAMTTAPGHEVSWYSGPIAAGAVENIVLRRAAAFDVELHCHEPPCNDHVLFDVDGPISMTRVSNTRHFERLPAGTYEVSAIQGFGAPGEHRGTATITTVVGMANHVAIDLHRIGTGLSISGTAEVRIGYKVTTSELHVTATCSGARGKHHVVRTTQTDAAGAFTLNDVGPAPCEVSITTGFSPVVREVSRSGFSTEVTELPASEVRLDGRIEVVECMQ